jgi:hypothetical protein
VPADVGGGLKVGKASENILSAECRNTNLSPYVLGVKLTVDLNLSPNVLGVKFSMNTVPLIKLNQPVEPPLKRSCLNKGTVTKGLYCRTESERNGVLTIDSLLKPISTSL